MMTSRVFSLPSRLRASDILTRQASGGPGSVTSRNLQALKKKQKAYQIDDGQVIWKKSKKDVLLYKATVALTFLGVGMSLHTFWRLSFAKHFE
ncbi:unnamed protein product [Acanthoscelides obtectus]|uniref:Uncharacterized protein n=1 Tax=Acanthoscelides obtectus TaxID=200917 RepID=A0A9P0M944_ACAOB|nr:unnamed protein product [Acanthoscelides obtectus]CAK1635146.1 hypothetical protein AOBTE_LOCUS9099 [Acanthoscelides obtectus]